MSRSLRDSFKLWGGPTLLNQGLEFRAIDAPTEGLISKLKDHFTKSVDHPEWYELMERLSESHPPFIIAFRLEELLRACLKYRSSTSTLKANLDHLITKAEQSILEIYTEDGQIEQLEIFLGTPQEWGSLPNLSIETMTHEQLVYTPLSNSELAIMATQKLEALDFGLQLRKLAQLETTIEKESTELRVLSEKMSLITRLNPFSGDENKSRHRQLKESLQRSLQTIVPLRADLRHRAREALSCYPPIQLYYGLRQLRFVKNLLSDAKVRNIDEQGKLVRTTLADKWSLVASLLGQIMEDFHGTFPDIPFPYQLRNELLGRDWTLPSPYQSFEEHLMQLCSEGYMIRSQIFSLLSEWTHFEESRAETAAGMGRFERLKIWQDNPDRETGKIAEVKAKELHSEVRLEWNRLLEASGQVLSSSFLAESQQMAVAAHGAVSSLAAESEIPGQRVPRVLGKLEALDCLTELQGHIQHHFHLPTDEADLYRLISESERARIELPENPLEPLAKNDVRSHLAQLLWEHDVSQESAKISDLEKRVGKLQGSVADVKRDLSFIEKANPFDKSPLKQEYKAQNKLLKQTKNDLVRAKKDVHKKCRKALREYLPAFLWLSLSDVIHAVQGVSAIAETTGQKVTVRRKHFYGYKEEEVTEYKGRLIGHAQAKESMRSWTANFIKAFGKVPDRRSLLDHWSLHDMGLYG